MIHMQTTSNFETIRALIARSGELLAPEISMALNRSSFALKAAINRNIGRRRKVKREALEDWAIHKSTPHDLESFAIIKGGRIGFDKLKTSKSNSGVRANIGGKIQHFRHGFYNVGPSFPDAEGNRTPHYYFRKKSDSEKIRPEFYMKGGKKVWLKGRFPIKRLTVVSAPQMADDDDILPDAVEHAHMQFLKQFNHRVNFLMEEYG